MLRREAIADDSVNQTKHTKYTVQTQYSVFQVLTAGGTQRYRWVLMDNNKQFGRRLIFRWEHEFSDTV